MPLVELSQRFQLVFDTYRERAGSSDEDRTLVFIDSVGEWRTFRTLSRVLLSLGVKKAVFVGFTDSVIDDRHALEEANFPYPVRLLQVPSDYYLHLGRSKVFSPYPSLSIDTAADQSHLSTKAPVRSLFHDLIKAMRQIDEEP